MATDWKSKWDERYRAPEYAYGTEPNKFLAQQLPQLTPGRILFAAEGEGRNAVFAARQGWSVAAFDLSVAGREKAGRLARQYGVEVDYRVGELPGLGFSTASFDALALIYAHVPPEVRPEYHRLLDTYLKPGGTIILEGFGEHHLPYRERDPRVGGPRDQETLFSMEEMRRDFGEYEVRLLEEREVELHEGRYHNGRGSVVRFIGVKSD